MVTMARMQRSHIQRKNFLCAIFSSFKKSGRYLIKSSYYTPAGTLEQAMPAPPAHFNRITGERLFKRMVEHQRSREKLLRLEHQLPVPDNNGVRYEDPWLNIQDITEAV
jgi:uncharacterized protein YcgL (UPF0745 family)